MASLDTARRPRALKIALGLSLALNLLILGAIAGAFWRHGGAGPEGRGAVPGARSYAAPYVQALPPDIRRQLHREMRSQTADRAENREARAAAYAQMLTALRAEPFDRAMAEDVLAAQGAAAAQGQTAAHAAWLGQVSAMSAPERHRYAQALEARLEDHARGKAARRAGP